MNSLEKFLSLSPEERVKLKVVLTGGVFDVIHMGHIYTLTEAKKHGNFLVVSIAGDSHIKKKGREPIHSQEYRSKLVEMLKPVDAVILGKDDPKEILEIIKPDVIVYGFDQEPFLKPKGVKIVKLSDSLNGDSFKTKKILEKFGL